MSKLIMFHQGALGDWVVTFPAIERLKTHFSRIDAICPGSHGELAVRLALIDAYTPVETTAVTTLFTGKPDPELIKAISAYDAVLLFSTSRELGRAIGDTGHSRLLVLAPKPPVHRPQHVTAYLMEVLQQNGWIEAAFSKAIRPAQVRAVFAQPPAGAPDRAPVVLLHPGSGSRLKNCPFEVFLETAALLQAREKAAAFILGPVEMEQYRWQDDLRERDFTVHQIQTLTDLLACLKRARAYIGNDSGPTHLAAYLGLPTVALFGASDARRWRPLGPLVKVLEPAEACPPCFETDSRDCSARTCFDHVSAPGVVAALETMLR